MGGGSEYFDSSDAAFSFSGDSGSILHDDDTVPSLRRRKTYLDVLRRYESSERRALTLPLLKTALSDYKPGDWIECVGGTTAADYDVPETITLLLVGPRASGKSSLVNRISRVFEDGALLPDRAQVSFNPEVSKGTCFLREYMIPRNSKSFCVYDTRGLSGARSDNYKLLEKWMTMGVRNGEAVFSDSDDATTKKSMKAMARLYDFNSSKRRTVNFVIFVVDGVSVLKSMESGDKTYMDMVVETFNYPFLSFRDNKPAVVVTHGDEHSLSGRARVLCYLGEALGIPPTKQIFDIPDKIDDASDLAILEMLRYSLEHADRNLPYKYSYLLEGMDVLPMMDKMQQVLEFLLCCLCLTIFPVWGCRWLCK